VGIFSSAELEDNLELVSLVEELFCVPEFRLVIMAADLHPELDLFDLGSAMFALLFLLGQLVLELSEIGYAADWRIGGRGNFDEVKPVGLGAPNGFLRFKDAQLLAGGADDDTYFACANTIVDADECWINRIWVRLALYG